MDSLQELHDHIDKKADNCVSIIKVLLNPRFGKKAFSEETISNVTGLPLDEVRDCLGIMERSGRVRRATKKNVGFWASNMRKDSDKDGLYKKIHKSNNAHMLHIPISLARAKGWDHGTEVRFQINEKGRLELVSREEDNKDKHE